MGYQDPGTYVNMAAHYERNGTTFIKDTLRERLTSQEKSYYDDMLTDDLYRGIVARGGQYGLYPRGSEETQIKLKAPQLLGYMSVMPGIYYKDLASSEYVFQFYPLHPLWMAICSYLFWETNGVYSLPFFALLTIIMFYRLAKDLSKGNEKVGLIAAGLLAINPLHTFFSKFPVTEVCFLFFTVSGFYYLAAYVRDREGGGQAPSWYLPLSVALFLCAFLTRVSGFLYMPFFYLLAVSLFITKDDEWRDDRKALFGFALAAIGTYFVSLCYGLTCSFPYTMEQFGLTIGKKAVRNWQLVLPVGLAILCVVPIVLRKGISAYGRDQHRRLYDYFRKGIVALMFAVLAAAASIAFARFLLKGKDAFMASTGVISVAHLTPFAFLLLISAFLWLRKDERIPLFHVWLALFIAIFWGLYTLGSTSLPYQYYYARYMLSEVVPYSLLFVALYLGRIIENPGRKGLAYMAIAAISVYSLYFTACQFKGCEADGVHTGLKKVADRVMKSDILFVTYNDFTQLMPLTYFFGLNAFRIEDAAVIKEKAGGILATMDNAFILSKSPVNRPGAELVEVIDYRKGQFEHAQHIPTQFAYVDQMKLYLYRIDKQVF